MIIYVKSKKDRDALKSVFSSVYGWSPPLRTLGVEHREMDGAIEEIPPEDFTLILLGKEDARWLKENHDNHFRKVEVFWKARVRNGRMRELVEFVERAKLRFLFDVRWDGMYLLGRRTNFLDNVRPGDDVYFVPEEWEYRGILSALVGRDVGTPMIHLRGNVEVLHAGREVLATVPRNGGRIVVRETPPMRLEKGELVRENGEHIEGKVEVTVRKIREVLGGREEVVVPFSGGKDSTVVALLLKEAGVDFTPVFVDTGGEYEETHRWIREMERVVGRVEVVEAPVAERYREEGEDYLLSRSCTRDKISTLYSFVERNFEDPVLVNGDRVAESRARSFRPDLRRDKFWVFSPIKLWSYLDEELYLWKRGLELPELYRKGFYRVGCFFCPFTDLIEHYVSRRW